MKTSWFAGLDADQKLDVKQTYLSSGVMRRRLKSMLQDKINEHFKAQQLRANYEKSNWAFEQADAMGYCRALNEVILLLLDDKNETVEVKKRGRPLGSNHKVKPLNENK